MAEAVALKRDKQTKFTKQVKNIKQKVNKGIIKIQEGLQPSIPKRPFGLIYLGHIPHGFYEDEMKEYFKQFGVVTNVKVCRSKKTGQSKGYGFVQFRHPEVAQIVAETMDNYLMFNRRLICRNIPPEKQTRTLFPKIVWSTKNYPLKVARKLHLMKRNNPSGEKYRDNTRKTMSKITKKMDKLKQLGVEHIFQPSHVPDDMQYLLKKNAMTNDGNSGNNKTKRKLKDVGEVCKDLRNKSLRTIKKKKEQLRLPKISFMQNDRLKRLAAVEIVKENLVKKVNTLKKLKSKVQVNSFYF